MSIEDTHKQKKINKNIILNHNPVIEIKGITNNKIYKLKQIYRSGSGSDL